MSRSDAKELGDLLESGQAAPIVIGPDRAEGFADEAHPGPIPQSVAAL
jgi:hypothetical protein